MRVCPGKPEQIFRIYLETLLITPAAIRRRLYDVPYLA
jgi:hypothetical protein